MWLSVSCVGLCILLWSDQLYNLPVIIPSFDGYMACAQLEHLQCVLMVDGMEFLQLSFMTCLRT